MCEFCVNSKVFRLEYYYRMKILRARMSGLSTKELDGRGWFGGAIETPPHVCHRDDHKERRNPTFYDNPEQRVDHAEQNVHPRNYQKRPEECNNSES